MPLGISNVLVHVPLFLGIPHYFDPWAGRELYNPNPWFTLHFFLPKTNTQHCPNTQSSQVNGQLSLF